MGDVFEDGLLSGIRRIRLPSKATDYEYDVLISLPVSYNADQGRQYPLLIVLDANYMFGTAVETAKIQALAGEADEMIVVGVGTPGGLEEHFLRRLRDYTPGHGLTLDRNRDNPVAQIMRTRLGEASSLKECFGGSVAFADFLKQELLPSLLADYRVNGGDLGIAGHSAAGSFVVDLLLRGPAPFTKLVAGDFGFVWYLEGELEHLEAGLKITKPDTKVYVGIAGAELQREFGDDLRGSLEVMERIKVSHPWLDLQIRIFEGETHTSSAAILLATAVRMFWPSGMTFTEGMMRSGTR